jgi:hypothetical protein
MQNPNETYAEQEGEIPFDWNAFLACDPKTLSTDNASEAREKAHMWATCACGNQCAVLPRCEQGGPLDPELRSLGYAFANILERVHTAIWEQDYKEAATQMNDAKATLALIEVRSATLLKELATYRCSNSA